MIKQILIAIVVVVSAWSMGLDRSEAEEHVIPEAERKYSAGPTVEQIEKERIRQAIYRMRASLQASQPRWVQLPGCYTYYRRPALIARQEAHRRFLFHAWETGLFKEVPLQYHFHYPGYHYPGSALCW